MRPRPPAGRVRELLMRSKLQPDCGHELDGCAHAHPRAHACTPYGACGTFPCIVARLVVAIPYKQGGGGGGGGIGGGGGGGGLELEDGQVMTNHTSRIATDPYVWLPSSSPCATA